MVSLAALWLPILLASVVVFAAGFLLNMVLPYHRTDFQSLDTEDDFRSSVGKMALEQGQYLFPHDRGVNKGEYASKVASGPTGILVIMKSSTNMTRQLILHLLYVIIISIVAGYIGSAALPIGTQYLKVFQVVGTAALLGYSGSLALQSIWYGFSWSFTAKSAVDGLIYALLTAGVFGWLWP